MDFSKKDDNPQPQASTEKTSTEDFADEALRNKYHLLKKLYEKEFETVYIAKSQDSTISTQYLVQQFTPQYSAPAQLAAAQQLFRKEVSNLQNLGTHPQIPSIYDYFFKQGQFFVVQEFIIGQSFQEELSEAHPYSEQEIIDFLKNILPAINFIHQNNYIHQYINLNNLIRGFGNRKIYLSNFDPIKAKINPKNLAVSGQFIPVQNTKISGYMPMEQKLGKPEFCSDIYALGIVVIQALTQAEPNQLQYDENNNPVWHHLLPNISDFNPRFLDIIDTMVRCDHHKRYQSAIAILSSLKKLKSKNPFTENTVIQQDIQSRPQFFEQTQIINNSNNSEQFSEQTQIINSLGTTNQFPENTLIIKENNLESTRIIAPQPIRRYSNTPKKENKFNLKIIAIIGTVLIAIIAILIAPKLKNKQNSVPQSSSLIYLSVSGICA